MDTLNKLSENLINTGPTSPAETENYNQWNEKLEHTANLSADIDLEDDINRDELGIILSELMPGTKATDIDLIFETLSEDGNIITPEALSMLLDELDPDDDNSITSEESSSENIRNAANTVSNR